MEKKDATLKNTAQNARPYILTLEATDIGIGTTTTTTTALR